MYQRIILIIILSSLLLITPALTAAQSPAPAWSVELLEAEANQVVVELTVNHFDQTAVTANGLTYQRLAVDDQWSSWGQPGDPGLPLYSLLLGMPTLGDPHIEILEADSQTYNLLVAPNPHRELVDSDSPAVRETFRPQPASYATDTFLPGDLAQAAEVGLMGYQPVFQLRLQPFQYNLRQQTLRLYHRLTVRVTFPKEGRAQPATGSAAFETVLQQSLANYASLPRPPLATSIGRQAPLQPAQATSRLKLRVRENSLYHVTYNDLQSAAPALLNSDPRNLEVTHQGTAIPILVVGEADGTFNPGDYLLFYGEAIDSLYTWDNVYWLQDKGSPGSRLSQRDGSPNGSPTATTFPISQHYEENKIHWQGMPNGEGKDHWFWEQLTGGNRTTELTFNLANIAGSGPTGLLRLSTHSATFGERQTQLRLNGQALLSPAETWRGRSEKLFEVAIPQNMLVEGQNRLVIENNPTSNPGNDTVDLYVDWFELTYQDTYVAENNQLRFNAPAAGNYTFEIGTFSTKDLVVLDITNPKNPVELTNLVFNVNGTAATLLFSDAVTANQQYIVQTTDQWLTPQFELDEPSSWQSPSNGATYVIITYPGFYDAIQTLADYRRNQGESVAVIKSTDLYDEFNGGIYDPQGIRSFLEYAYANWSPRPVYVLLVGDASQDPKNYRGNSNSDMLPAYYVNAPLFGEAASDYWYAKVNGADDYPDLIMGRLPVRFGYQLTAILDKIPTYEQSPPAGEWSQRLILAADDDTADFQEDMEILSGLLPAQFTPTKMYGYDSTTSVADELNQGALLLSYSGHGNDTVWGKWNDNYRIFENSYIDSLTNGNKLPFMTVGNCLTGYFTSFKCCDSMAEKFLFRSNNAGIAVWAPTSYGFPTPNRVIHQKLYEALFTNEQFAMGQAALTARLTAHTTRPDLRIYFETFNFFGDPATSLNVPSNIELTGHVDPQPVRVGEPLTYTLAYTISGAKQAREVTLVSALPADVTFETASIAPTSIYTQTLTWELGDQPPGRYNLIISATVNISGSVHGQTLSNHVDLSEASGLHRRLQLDTTVEDVPITGLVATSDSPTLLGEPTNLSAATDSGTHVLYTWDLGDSSPPQTGATIQYSYPQIGNYEVTVTAQNGAGTLSQTLTVQVGGTLSADFSSSTPDLLGQESSFASLTSGITYTWRFGDGTTTVTSQPTISHTYSAIGDYPVTLTVTNQFGSQGATTKTMTILTAPTANFEHNGPQEVGQTIQFSNTSQFGSDSGANITYLWDFGDGDSILLPNPSHQYDVPGNYLVSLTTYNRVASDTVTATVEVTAGDIQGLTVESSSPTMIGQTTFFTATTPNGGSLSYQWEFGDGTAPQNGASTINHIYPAVGNYTVRVTATNASTTINRSLVVTVTDTPPQANLVTSAPDLVGQMTTFQSSSVGNNLSYAWDLGDGTRLGPSQTPTVTHNYLNVGRYTVVLTVSNGAGSDVVSRTIEILQTVTPPTANFETSSPDYLGQETQFRNTSQDGGATTVSYQWQFGDGAGSRDTHPSHTYPAIGSYVVTLTITTDQGSDTATQTVTISDQPLQGLTIQQDGPTIIGQTTHFSAVVGAGSGLTYEWAFGDGITGTGQYTSHQYSQVGSYLVTLTATNSLGSQVATTTVIIRDESLTGLTLVSSSPTDLGQATYLTATLETGSNVTYSWDFGDGRTAISSQPSAARQTHTYQTAGSYEVKLVASNSRGVQVAQTTVVVQVEPLTGLTITTSSPTPQGSSTYFTATVSGGGNVTYLWDFGDNSTGTGPTPQHRYSVAGEYVVKVVASNSLGSQTMTETVVIFSEICPTGDEPIAGLTIATNSPVLINQTTFFTTNLTTGSNITYTWQFGDGQGSQARQPTHSYANVGEYRAVLTATNCWGSLVRETPVIVQDEAIAGLTVDYQPATPLGQSTILTATTTAGSNIIYSWQFADGTAGNGAVVSQTFQATGVYTGLVTAVNSHSVMTAPITITVRLDRNDGTTFLPLIMK